jgi:hypothetical protein
VPFSHGTVLRIGEALPCADATSASAVSRSAARTARRTFQWSLIAGIVTWVKSKGLVRCSRSDEHLSDRALLHCQLRGHYAPEFVVEDGQRGQCIRLDRGSRP